LSIWPQAAKNDQNSLNARRAKLDEPPASGYIAVASAYVAAVHRKITPVIRKTIGVSPSASDATRPSA
jgi:hypothetical protein